MSNTVAMIIVVVAVVLVVAVVALLLVRTRGRERRAREAHELRTQAAAQSTHVEHAQREAAARQAAADQARERGRDRRGPGHARPSASSLQTEAQREDTIREADRARPVGRPPQRGLRARGRHSAAPDVPSLAPALWP